MYQFRAALGVGSSRPAIGSAKRHLRDTAVSEFPNSLKEERTLSGHHSSSAEFREERVRRCPRSKSLSKHDNSALGSFSQELSCSFASRECWMVSQPFQIPAHVAKTKGCFLLDLSL
ncbi:expressed unknown protein [Seminavis robusta]|uniref:Uncharacterized protein n=1 Tax=Seminavis robusta TaxID=568900 RepID=A0A9N8HDH1_9STRA|nr:expressed unknown protein [Seminavis robusta]|eukprot:Sro343_g122041.1  (117) ;mRNA; r:53507-53952